METPVTENYLLFGWLLPLSTHCFVFSSVQACLEQARVSKGREGGEGQAPDLQEASHWFLGLLVEDCPSAPAGRCSGG